MNKIVLVKPTKVSRVRDPKSNNILSSDGLRVEMNSFWGRRIKDGSVELVDETPKKMKWRGKNDN